MNQLENAPPLASKRPTRIAAQGDVRIDDYFWLRDRDDPTVRAYLQAENEYTAAIMAHTEPLQEQLYGELCGRIKEQDQTVPEPNGAYDYYERVEPGAQYVLYCRRRRAEAGMLGAEEVLLDVNALAVGQSFTGIGNVKVNPDHRLLAYTLDTVGDETFTLYIKDLTTGALLDAPIPNTYYGLEWANDSQTLFYTVLNPAKRPYQIYRHRVGQMGDDALVLVEPDERYHLSIEKSRSGVYLFFLFESNTTHEVRFLAADMPFDPPGVVMPRQPGVEYSVTHHGERFFITINEEAVNFRVLVAPVTNLARAGWQEWLPHRPAVMVMGTDAFRQHLVVYEREGGVRQVRIVDLVSGADGRVTFPEPIYALFPAANPEFNTHLLRITYQSLITPSTVYDIDMATHTLHLRKRDDPGSGYDPADYTMTRVWATAADGAQVPISLAHRKGLPLDGNNPTLMRGYGAYGATWDAYFDANRISLLERGFVVAIAHIRGGSELGREWYLQGKLLHKLNSFTDFIACAETLITQGYTRPEKMVAQGRSAGGLLMGAVANLRPDLFAGIIAGVPFVDVISTMLDPSIPLTTMEYTEWGDPAIPEQYAYMRAYSPYDNLADQRYPHILATAGFNDPRVQYWEPAKWVAKLRTLHNNPNRVLLKTEMTVGHAGASGRYDALREVAFEYAFVLDCVGLT
jgi:oligopeptidase B